MSFLGRWVDLYARADNGATIAVELKVTEWRRALQQAALARGCADETFVALWAPYVHRALTDEAVDQLRGLGIGLMSVNGTCEVKIAAAGREPRFGRYVILPSRASHLAR